ncbi:hypothetical protein N9O13_06345 [Crocinitomicaceae bacterium]|nr:hypothetical protein [Crocinitomicaceae bacterium]
MKKLFVLLFAAAAFAACGDASGEAEKTEGSDDKDVKTEMPPADASSNAGEQDSNNGEGNDGDGMNASDDAGK